MARHLQNNINFGLEWNLASIWSDLLSFTLEMKSRQGDFIVCQLMLMLEQTLNRPSFVSLEILGRSNFL